MPFDFPNSPLTGQSVIASNGLQYTYDGVKWMVTGGSGGGSFAPYAPGTISSLDYGCIPDFVFLTGTVSWSGTTVTIASGSSGPGANFTAADIGKKLIMPYGGAAGPAIVTITAVLNSTSVTVASATNSFTGATQTLWYPGGGAPSGILLDNATSSGGAKVSDLVQLDAVAAPAIHPATLYTLLITAKSATVVHAGAGGPPAGTVYLRATTGHGKRALFSATTAADGSLAAGTVLTLVEGGCLYANPTNMANEPLEALQNSLALPGTWSASGTSLVLVNVDPQLYSLVRVGQSLSALSDAGTVGIASTALVTAVDTTTVAGQCTVSFSPAATAGGTGQDVTFTSNQSLLPVTATPFAAGVSTIVLTAPLPSWVQVGALIGGQGLAGSRDPNANPVTQTAIATINGPRTTITLGQPGALSTPQPTTTASVGVPTLTINAVLTGVTASISYVPAAFAVKDPGLYASLPTTALAVTTVGNSDPAVSTPGTNSGCKITLQGWSGAIGIGFGTDNGPNFANWAAAVVSAANADSRTPAGIKPVIQPGNYLTTQPINLYGMQAQALDFECKGVSIHSCAAGKVAVEMRHSRWFGLPGLSIYGDYYFPPLVGLTIGVAQTGFTATDVFLQHVFATGSFQLAGASFQGNEVSLVEKLYVANARCPVSPSDPVFGIIVDGGMHWTIPCDFGPIFPPGTAVSFNDLQMVECSAVMSGGGIPWTVNRGNALRLKGCYAATYGPPACLWFGDFLVAYMELHTETQYGTVQSAHIAGAQDVYMLAYLANPILQFRGEHYDYTTNGKNSIFAYDLEGKWSPGAPTSVRMLNAKVEVRGFNFGVDSQVFDRFGPLISNSFIAGSIYAGSILHSAMSHFFNMPDIVDATITKGDQEQNITTANGAVTSDNVIGRLSLRSSGDAIVDGNVYANTAFFVGKPGVPPAGRWDQTSLRLGVLGTPTVPSTLSPQLQFAISGNTGVTGATGPTIGSGSGAATGTQPNGSLWLRSDGSTNARTYVSTGSAWESYLASSYTATGGTTARSAQDRAAEWTNVKDFGAVMNGSTDDYAAITAAIATLVAGDVLYFPPSPTPCMLSQSITVPTGVTVWAQPGTVTLKPTATNTASVLLLKTTAILTPFTGQSNVVIYGLTFDGGGQDFGSANPVAQAFQCNGITLDHCTFQNCRGIAFNGSNVNDLMVRSCKFINIGNRWKTTTTATDRRQALTNINSGQAGDYTVWGNRAAVIDCQFSDIGLDPINFGSLTNVRITGNGFNLANQHVLLPAAGAFPSAIFPLYCSNVTITGNTINNAPGSGIDAPGMNHATISGNVIKGCGGTAIGLFDGALYARGALGTTNVVITGNVLENNGQWSGANVRSAIGFYDTTVASDSIRIANNILSDNQGTPTQPYGVDVTSDSVAPTNVWVDPSNVLLGNVTAAISPRVPASATAITYTAAGAAIMSVLRSSTTYANDAAAAGGGVAVGQLYRNGSAVQIRVS